MPNLTKRVLDAAKPAADDFFVWCSGTPGFGARVYPSGKKIFVAQIRVGRAQRRIKIGPFGAFTVEQARQRAEELIRAAADGVDPRIERDEAKTAISVGQLCDLYLEAAQAGLVQTRFRQQKRASTIKVDEGRIARHIKPLIGSRIARDLTSADVQRLADDVTTGKTAGTFKGKTRGKAIVAGGAGTAARVVGLLGGIYSWAVKRKHVPDMQPTRRVETVQSGEKDRILSPDELHALGRTLDRQKGSKPGAVAALTLIALSGLRREEACSLRWSEIDASASCLRLTDTKTGRSMRAIGQPVVDLVASVDRLSETWLFPNRQGTGSADLKKAIADLMDEAGLADARAHDLRRTFSSAAADLGYGEATIGELLGHARRGVTTKHYIRRPDAALVAAADRVARHLAALMSGHQGKLVDLAERSAG